MRQGACAAFVHRCINYGAQAIVGDDEAILIGIKPFVQGTVGGIARYQFLDPGEYGIKRGEIDQFGSHAEQPFRFVLKRYFFAAQHTHTYLGAG